MITRVMRNIARQRAIMIAATFRPLEYWISPSSPSEEEGCGVFSVESTSVAIGSGVSVKVDG